MSERGTDIHSPAKRSEIMSRVKSKNTKPEVLVRSQLHRAGLRFRLHRKDLPGRPDIVMPSLRTVILVHGCFWHQHPGCKKTAIPKQNAEFWEAKLLRNVERDRSNREQLEAMGWNVEVLWQCRLKADVPELIERLQARRDAAKESDR